MLRYFCWVVLLLAAACAGAGSAEGVPLDAAAVPTMAVRTLQALQTAAALSATPTLTALPATATLYPTATLAPSSTPRPTRTVFPTFTPGPSLTPRPVMGAGGRGGTVGGGSATGASGSSGGGAGSGSDSSAAGAPAPSRCNSATLVEDITFPDGTVVSPAARFTKIWRVKNTGSCAWDGDYRFVLHGGQDMGAEEQKLPKKVAPGETVDLAVAMTAPGEPGAYRGKWMLRAGEDDLFGQGVEAKKPLLVEIVVEAGETNIHYDFAANTCAAAWESSADEGDLECPGEEGDTQGLVQRLSDPALETRHENQPAIWTNPEAAEEGWIRGEYPAVDVQAGDRFIADIGCLEGAEKCDVLFQLRYRIAGEEDEKKLGEWEEEYDEAVTRVDLDLNDLAGKSVRFILVVRSGKVGKEDAAFWLVPQLRRK